MCTLKVGDIVSRKSYDGDVLFKVVAISNVGGENIVSLKGILYRIEADAPESDLMIQTAQEVSRYMKMA